MHHPGEYPVEVSRFKLPLSQPEGPPDQAELRGLFFTAVEDSLDIAATLDNQEAQAFQQQLRYAGALAVIGEQDRSQSQFRLALASAESGTAHDGSEQDAVEAPEFLRNQAVALAATASAMYKSGNRYETQPVIAAAVEKLNLALITDNESGLHIPDMFRSIREPIAILKLAGSLADTGHIDMSEVWRKYAGLDLHTYQAHLEALEHQKTAAGKNSPEWHVASGRQEGIIGALRAGFADALQYGDERAYVKIEHIAQLYKVAANYGIELEVTDLLKAYEDTIERDRPEIIPGTDDDEDIIKYKPRTAWELEQDYRELANAYFLTGSSGKAMATVLKAMDYVRDRLRDGDDEAMESLASAQLQLRNAREAKSAMANIELRYRLELRYEQARIALSDRKVDEATAVLDTAMGELVRRFEEGGSDEDDFETSMGLKFVKMYDELGQHARMDEAYKVLEEHDEQLQPWSYMRGENHGRHRPIARAFLSSGKVSRAFDAIRFADDNEQAAFLVDAMEIICAPEPKPLEAMVINEEQLLVELQNFTKYLEQQRQS